MRHVCPECGEAADAGTCAKDGAVRAPAGTDALLGERIGSWRIAKLIGAGGMGRVYLGVQPDIGARVAIKVLKDADDTEVVERFFNEARAVNVIRHEGIVDIIDLGRLAGGAPYIVMELLHGVPLRALIHRTPRPHAGALATIIVDVLAALEAAHAKQIIHRDLKPDNVFVSPAGRVTVLDFGIAKLAADAISHTKSGGLLGTPAYMSPEQARAETVDARSDLYALGVILYEAATGELPFGGPSVYALLDQHVNAKPKPPREIDPAIPVALEAVILRALAKDPAARYASAAAMRTALAAALEPLPKSELQLPSTTPRTTSADPNGVTQGTFATNASTLPPRTPSESLVYGETRASSDRPRTAPAGTEPERTLRVSRGLVALMAGSALLGLAAVAYVVVRDREPTGRIAIVADAMVVDAPVDAPPVDAPPIDAFAVDAPLDAISIDAPPRKIVVATPPPPDLTKGAADLAVPNPKSFDPAAYFKTALAKAEWIAGGAVRPAVVRWRKFDRNGRIDLDVGSAEYFFIMKDPKPAGYCYVTIILQDGGGKISLASTAKPCAEQGGVQVPSCSIAQLWERAIADGAPADATEGNANMMGRWWMFSTPGDPSTHQIKNDCE